MAAEFDEMRRDSEPPAVRTSVRKKSSRGRSSPTTPNAPLNAFPQVKPCLPASTNLDQQPPKPRVNVPLQRLSLSSGWGRGPGDGATALRFCR